MKWRINALAAMAALARLMGALVRRIVARLRARPMAALPLVALMAVAVMVTACDVPRLVARPSVVVRCGGAGPSTIEPKAAKPADPKPSYHIPNIMLA